MKKICFTGGGSSGHVTPNLAIIEALPKEVSVFYIGSYKGIEKELVQKNNIAYYAISSGKLRRYFSWENFIDPFKILKGIIQAYFKLKKLKPNIVFSKGGFVTFPVALAAKLNKIPVICHESDFIPGLANKLVFPLAETICLTFEASKRHIKYKDKLEITGAPIRSAFLRGDKERALKTYNFDRSKKTLLVTGGGLGSVIINDTIWQCLDELLQQFNVIHLTGRGKSNKEMMGKENYAQLDYLNEPLFDAMALADLVISRAGSNSLYELLLLKKQHILIPLSKKASRGDQIDNAHYFEEKGLSFVLHEEDLSKQNLMSLIKETMKNSENYQNRLNEYHCPNGTEKIVSILKNYV